MNEAKKEIQAWRRIVWCFVLAVICALAPLVSVPSTSYAAARVEDIDTSSAALLNTVENDKQQMATPQVGLAPNSDCTVSQAEDASIDLSKQSDAASDKESQKLGTQIVADQAPDGPSIEAASSEPKVIYKTHVQNYGWQEPVSDGAEAGTVGQSLRLEGVKVDLSGGDYSGNILYKTQIENNGWESDWKSNNEMSGTEGQALRLETIRIELSGDIASHYSVWYRVHVQDYGWLDWACDGADAGTVGLGKRLEAIQIKLVAQGAAAPGKTVQPNVEPFVGCTAHVENVGWQGEVYDGATAGSEGQSQRLEALQVRFVQNNALRAVDPDSLAALGDIYYAVHVQNIGWQNEVANGEIAGTTGESLRIEALKMRMTGNVAANYDLYYRVHVENQGWMGWAKDDNPVGTTGMSLRVEALQVMLVQKGSPAPGSESNSFIDGGAIMGQSMTSVDQMARFFNANASYPSDVYSSKGAPSSRDFCQILYDEAASEGVRAEVVFSQSVLETGWLSFGGAVSASQCNFAGIGAVDSDASASSYIYENVRMGLRAQIQHLKAYASTEALNNPIVHATSVRKGYIEDGSRYQVVGDSYGFGCAPTVSQLSEKWASSSVYGDNIMAVMTSLLAA